MNKKEIQEQRMRGYFIQATKEILRGEGLVCVSVRNVADKAGYSYATLYNYFKDIKELIFLCVKDFQEECIEFINSETNSLEPGIEKIKGIIKAYNKYFIQYHGIFELFFIERISGIGSKHPTIDLIYKSLDDLCIKEWEYCMNNGLLKKDEFSIIKDQIKFTVTGMLLFFINRRRPDSYEEFMSILDIQIDRILDAL